MSSGTYWDGKRWVKPEDFRRPNVAPRPKPPRKEPPKPQPKPETDDDHH